MDFTVVVFTLGFIKVVGLFIWTWLFISIPVPPLTSFYYFPSVDDVFLNVAIVSTEHLFFGCHLSYLFNLLMSFKVFVQFL